MEASTPGRTFTTKGLASTHRFRYASFWVDHATSFVYVTFHATKAAQELIASKEEFETWAGKYNVSIKSIRADNGVYAAKAFQDSCRKHQQRLTFCAVGAHWQNGIAERFIGTITERARTILLHSMHHWSSMIQEDFWPFAVRHAVAFHNASIRKGKSQCPYELFTGEPPPTSLPDFRVFGSPIYVLRKELQDHGKLGKWSSRAWQGIYIGPSSCHSGNVPLIYNPTTTHISPQFHVTYDEFFQTVTPSTKPLNDILDQLFGTSAEWSYKDPYTDEPYTFATLWSGTSPVFPSPATGRKRKQRPPSTDTNLPQPPLRGSPRHAQEASQSNPTVITFRGSSPTILHTTQDNVLPVPAQEEFQDNVLIPHAQEASQGNALSPCRFHWADRGTASGQSLSHAQEAPHDLDISNNCDRRHIAMPPDLPDDLYEFYRSNISADASPSQPDTTIPDPATRHHMITYMARPSTVAHHSSFKRRRLIDDSVYVLTSRCHHVPEPVPPARSS